MPFSIPVWMVLLMGATELVDLPLPSASDAPSYVGGSTAESRPVESRSVYDRADDAREHYEQPAATQYDDEPAHNSQPIQANPLAYPAASPGTAILPFRRGRANESSSNEPAAVRHDPRDGSRPESRYEAASDSYAIPSESHVRPATYEQPGESPPSKPAESAIETDKPTSEKKTPGDKPLKLAPKSSSKSGSGHPRAATSTGLQPLITVGGSLAAVLALFFVTTWITRKSGKNRNRSLPSDVVELLGRTSLMPKQSLQMLRVGNKLLLVSITPGCVETITEITEPAEVERLAGLCQRSKAGSMTEVFQQVLTKMEREPAPGGFLGLDENFTRTDPEDDAARAIRKRRGGRYV